MLGHPVELTAAIRWSVEWTLWTAELSVLC